MTKLTIKIDENISLTGTIVTEDDSEDYDLYYYQPDCPWGANCEYAGNIVLPLEGNITSNIAPPMPAPPGWTRPKGKSGEWYNMSRNLSLLGNLSVNGNADILGTIKGVGSLSSIAVLTDTQTPPTPTWTGRKGEMACSGDFVYLCIETDKWIRWSVEKTW